MGRENFLVDDDMIVPGQKIRFQSSKIAGVHQNRKRVVKHVIRDIRLILRQRFGQGLLHLFQATVRPGAAGGSSSPLRGFLPGGFENRIHKRLQIRFGENAAFFVNRRLNDHTENPLDRRMLNIGFGAIDILLFQRRVDRTRDRGNDVVANPKPHLRLPKLFRAYLARGRAGNKQRLQCIFRDIHQPFAGSGQPKGLRGHFDRFFFEFRVLANLTGFRAPANGCICRASCTGRLVIFLTQPNLLFVLQTLLNLLGLRQDLRFFRQRRGTKRRDHLVKLRLVILHKLEIELIPLPDRHRKREGIQLLLVEGHQRRNRKVTIVPSDIRLANRRKRRNHVIFVLGTGVKGLLVVIRLGTKAFEALAYLRTSDHFGVNLAIEPDPIDQKPDAGQQGHARNDYEIQVLTQELHQHQRFSFFSDSSDAGLGSPLPVISS